ncbi:MAG: sugar phosphate isomerase/epimerase [Planctomycetaceae bacterium]|nr:sugar phosphate isomerase/epimerase [Planctomycetaceae bacterium]
MQIKNLYVSALLASLFIAAGSSSACAQETTAPPTSTQDLYSDENLTAWLVMFTDPTKRTPDERAAMLERLHFKRVGFEAFDKYVPLLESQMEAYERHGIEVTSVYVVINTEKPSEESSVKKILEVLQRRKATPEIWAMFPRGAFQDAPADKRLETMITAFTDLAKAVDAAGCRLGLYNYGSWFGEVDMQLAIIDGVRERSGIRIGTVFNFHRGHQHMQDFPAALERMKPHLMAVNLNGMNLKDAKPSNGNAIIIPLGQGDHEVTMMKQLAASGYTGPIGIIDHRSGVDAEEALIANLEGLKVIRKKLDDPDDD